MNPSTGFKFRAQAKKIPGPILIDPGMSHFYPQDPAKATFGPRRFQQNLRKTPLFAQFLRHAQISILEILNVFLRLKFSPFLNLNKNLHFSKVSMPFVRTGLLTSPPLQRPSHSDSKSGAHGQKGSFFQSLVTNWKKARSQRRARPRFYTSCGWSYSNRMC